MTDDSKIAHLVEKLSKITLFCQLNQESRINLAKELKLVYLMAGETLFTQAETGDALYLVLNGRLRKIGRASCRERV